MCPSGCGPLYKPGKDLRDTTCPCGFGYFDRDGLFVAGDRVRGGQAVSREAYEKHSPSCPVHADPRHREADAPASFGSAEQGHGFRDYFMPGTGIDLEVLKIYVSRDGGFASARPTTFHGQSGYLIHAKQQPTVEFIANIKADSAHIVKLRRKYGEKMPPWAPAETRLQGRQSSGQRAISPEGRQISSERRESTAVTPNTPFVPQYQTTYAWSGQQPPLQTGYYPSPGMPYPASPLQYRYTAPPSQYANSPEQRSLPEQQTPLADRFGQFSISQASDIDPHSSTTRSPFEQSSRPIPTAIDQQTRATQTREPLSQGVSGNEHQEIRPATEEQSAQRESVYQPAAESGRPLTSTTSYSSSSPPRNFPRTQDMRMEQTRDERPRQAERPERTYTEPKSQRTTIASSTRRTHTNARKPPSSRSARREQAPDNQSPSDEDGEEPPRRRAGRDPPR
ncbi:hypothetical protein GJ744_011041 [Endocarpon pusillum]|uniref:Uncharacterized protein n=1 Tax=Endocarpon pusillum TaxID=364733 RepID=A0A8H7AFP2_9EURO|nr:hypothetical protein GJ744_011041 [Endocarpon pusillum]